MKKLLITGLVLFGAFGLAVRASVFAPEWTEFCPPHYCDSNESVFSKDATYWYKRRLQFYNSLAKCNSMTGAEQDACYDEMRAAEGRKNQVWAVRQAEKYRTEEFNREYEMERMQFYNINRIIETIKRR
ncbi:MAG: hypothetical protein K6C94_03700 [Candidatus Gastranaerophilales bacterium]|nr:hypothetical protein [Candidatus Gastranaerophilales bacterium]